MQLPKRSVCTAINGSHSGFANAAVWGEISNSARVYPKAAHVCGKRLGTTGYETSALVAMMYVGQIEGVQSPLIMSTSGQSLEVYTRQ
jgi:hypothetical protein